MAELSLTNFKYGLDTRRSELSSLPGTLLVLNNAHINEGAECEKRKAFVQSGLPSGVGYTFGMLPTDTTILVFGSAIPGVVTGLPSGFSYQQLIHPNGSTAMSGVVSQTLYSGNAFVAAQFSDGNVFCYYNGQLVQDFISGLVTPWSDTDAQIATALAALVNATSNSTVGDEPVYTAVVDGTGDNVDVSSTPSTASGTPFTATASVTTSASGAITTNLLSTGTASTASAQAVGSFSIAFGSVVSANQATITVTFNSNATTSDFIAIGTSGNQTAYNFVNTINNTQPDIKIGANASATAANFAAAVNTNGTPGTQYSSGLTANTFVTASVVGAVVTLTAIAGGSVGNSVIFTTLPSQSRITPAGNTNLSGGTNSGSSVITNVNVGPTNVLSASVAYTTLPSATAALVAQNITANFNSNGGFTAQANNGTVTILGPTTTPASYNSLPISIIVTGQIAIQQMAFGLSGLSSGFAISSITVGGGGNLLSGTQTYTSGTAGAFCATVASNIFGQSGTSTYTAAADTVNAIVYVSPLTSTSTTTPGTLAITYTGTGTVAAGSPSSLSAQLSQTSLTGTVKSQTNTTNTSKTPQTYTTYTFSTSAVICTVSGGTPPYKYQWAYIGSGTSRLVASSPKLAATSWSGTFYNATSAFSEQWACTVTDSASPTPATSTSPTLNIYVPI